MTPLSPWGSVGYTPLPLIRWGYPPPIGDKMTVEMGGKHLNIVFMGKMVSGKFFGKLNPLYYI